jgi:hypothetical protein
VEPPDDGNDFSFGTTPDGSMLVKNRGIDK